MILQLPCSSDPKLRRSMTLSQTSQNRIRNVGSIDMVNLGTSSTSTLSLSENDPDTTHTTSSTSKPRRATNSSYESHSRHGSLRQRIRNLESSFTESALSLVLHQSPVGHPGSNSSNRRLSSGRASPALDYVSPADEIHGHSSKRLSRADKDQVLIIRIPTSPDYDSDGENESSSEQEEGYVPRIA
jgi:hypothetical protein